ncbi:MAG: FbpB family small basic protein [Sporolactobacillus sp.]
MERSDDRLKKRYTFKELVLKNKSEIMKNDEVLERIEERIEERHALKD